MKSIPYGNRPGLYLVARFAEKPNGPAQPDAKEVVYIGVTTGKSQSIHKRLQKFFKASQVGEMVYKHSGGNRFNRVMGNDLSNMYAAGFAAVLEDERFLNPFIFYTERRLIWEYIAKWGAIPACNGY